MKWQPINAIRKIALISILCMLAFFFIVEPKSYRELFLYLFASSQVGCFMVLFICPDQNILKIRDSKKSRTRNPLAWSTIKMVLKICLIQFFLLTPGLIFIAPQGRLEGMLWAFSCSTVASCIATFVWKD